MYVILNLLAKNILGHDTQILLFFQCPVLHKNACVLGCLDCVCGCQDGVWMGSESVWECINTRMSWYQDIAIPNPLAKFKLGHTRILPFLPVPSIAKMSMSVGVWMVFEGVWIMSRWCLRVSGEASMPNLFMILRYCLSSSAGIA